MNFLGAELTAACYEEFHQKRWELFNSKKARACEGRVGCAGCAPASAAACEQLGEHGPGAPPQVPACT
jgi:hypothetical protein